MDETETSAGDHRNDFADIAKAAAPTLKCAVCVVNQGQHDANEAITTVGGAAVCDAHLRVIHDHDGNLLSAEPRWPSWAASHRSVDEEIAAEFLACAHR